jgi:putative tryptophan/tyrosine transport system substrate-binding protein
MRRREFLTGLAGTVWPVVTCAQQSAIPLIGLLGVGSFDTRAEAFVTAFRGGLSEVGFVENRNVAIEQRWTGGRNELLTTLAAELVNRRVALIVAVGSTRAAVTAKSSYANHSDRL